MIKTVKRGKGFRSEGITRLRKGFRENGQGIGRGISKPSARRLARRFGCGGVKRIPGRLYDDTCGIMKVYPKNAIRDKLDVTMDPLTEEQTYFLDNDPDARDDIVNITQPECWDAANPNGTVSELLSPTNAPNDDAPSHPMGLIPVILIPVQQINESGDMVLVAELATLRQENERLREQVEQILRQDKCGLA